jgi:probable phosphoglycerate mutase
MTTTYILRHGQTDYSKQYLVNGDPSRTIRLNDEGVRSCRLPWSALPLHGVRTWLTSEFPRAQQTASLLVGVLAPELVVDVRLISFLSHPWFSSVLLRVAGMR